MEEDEPQGYSLSEVKTTVERLGKYEYYVVSFNQIDENGNKGRIINYVHYFNGYEYGFHYETYVAQTSIKSVKEWISTVTTPGEAALPEPEKK